MPVPSQSRDRGEGEPSVVNSRSHEPDPWAILPEVDYLAATRLGERVARAFAEDLSAGVFRVEGRGPRDLAAAWALMKKYPRLPLGLVDAVVMVHAERLKARAIVTLDARHFRAVKLAGPPG